MVGTALQETPLHRAAVRLYEWRKSDRKPFGFDLANGNMIGFAGLWDAWKDLANGRWLQSFAIVVTEPNELMASVHDRMPVILHPRDFDRWLTRDEKERPPFDLLRPFPADEMEAFEVSPDVGNVKNNSPQATEKQVMWRDGLLAIGYNREQVHRILRPVRAREGEKVGLL